MSEETSYIAYRTKPNQNDDHFEIGKVFDSAIEAADFFGVRERSLKVIAKDRHAVRGKQPETWMVFHEDIPIIDVESELERRL